MNPNNPLIRHSRAGGNPVLKIGLCAFALITAPLGHAEDLGRLFFTPEQRAHLEHEHTRNATAEEGPSSSVLTVNGIVQKHGGERTVWINGVPQIAGNSDELAPESVPVAVPGQSKPVKVKVGQKLLLDSVPEHKPAPQHPTDAGNNDD